MPAADSTVALAERKGNRKHEQTSESANERNGKSKRNDGWIERERLIAKGDEGICDSTRGPRCSSKAGDFRSRREGYLDQRMLNISVYGQL